MPVMYSNCQIEYTIDSVNIQFFYRDIEKKIFHVIFLFKLSITKKNNLLNIWIWNMINWCNDIIKFWSSSGVLIYILFDLKNFPISFENSQWASNTKERHSSTVPANTSAIAFKFDETRSHITRNSKTKYTHYSLFHPCFPLITILPVSAVTGAISDIPRRHIIPSLLEIFYDTRLSQWKTPVSVHDTLKIF